jgi:predicted phage terminase large subunit-like protein
MISRGFLKTSYIIAYMVNQILNDPEVRILYRMSSASNAESTLDSIATILSPSNPVLAHFFPYAVLDPKEHGTKATATRIRVKRNGVYREGTIDARGIDSKITGGHYTHQIIDDPVDEKMVDSESTQDTAINRVKRSDSLFVEPNKNIEIIVGTRWPGMFYQWLIEDSGIADEYWSMILGCYKDARYADFLQKIGREVPEFDGEKDPVWPEHFSVETLDRIERKSPYDFIHQYLNLAVEEGGRRFNKEDFNHYWIDHDKMTGTETCFVPVANGSTYRVPVHRLYRTVTIDPATGEHGKTDQSAITTCGFDRKTGMIFLLDAVQGRWLPDELIDRIIGAIRRWKPHVVAPEDVSFQKTLKHFLKQEMSRQGVGARIQPVKPGRIGKGRRILDALQPFVAGGQLFVQKIHDRTVVDELCSLQVVGGKVVGRSPNLADSLSYHAEFWRGLELRQIEVEDPDDRVKEAHEDVDPQYGLQCLT